MTTLLDLATGEGDVDFWNMFSTQFIPGWPPQVPPWTVPGQSHVTGVAVDGTYVYWTTNASDPKANAGAILRGKP